MKVTLQYTLPEESEEFKDATKGSDYLLALHAVRNQIFRPARKHGYSHTRIQELINNPECEELISLLEDRFDEILSEYDIRA